VAQNNEFTLLYVQCVNLYSIFLLEPSRCVFTKYSKSKFSQNTTILLSIKVATRFDSRSHHQANYWTMCEVQQVKVHVSGIPKCLQQWENVGTNEVDIFNINLICTHVLSLFLISTSFVPTFSQCFYYLPHLIFDIFNINLICTHVLSLL
jgi:hypothetical protein